MSKFKLNLKLFFLFKVLIVYSFLYLHSFADNNEINEQTIVLGSSNAPVKIKLFSSLTCPHCATFHNKVVSKIKKEFIENGKVQLIFFDFPLDQAAFNASKLLHCLEDKYQMKYLDIIYNSQGDWSSGSNIDEINEKLQKIVNQMGMSQDNFNKCLINDAIADKILNFRIEASKQYSITSTPTIIINEKKIDSDATFKNIKKKIENII
jgi:protein-disulfide isomerase|tara:strand:+ start:1797 stop:2420 length:624 start_codon:yes stop_codon:yes gene_type:complete